ncbi:hypothetical protein MRX96_057443 [Rhipicephalus microplus]
MAASTTRPSRQGPLALAPNRSGVVPRGVRATVTSVNGACSTSSTCFADAARIPAYVQDAKPPKARVTALEQVP